MKLLTFFLVLSTVCVTSARTYEYDDDGRLIGVAYPTGEGIAYTYDDAGNLLEVIALTLPAAPSDLTATRNESETVLTWVDNSDNETGFQIYRRDDGIRSNTGSSYSPGWRLWTTLAADTQTYTDSDINTQSTYEYRVVATSANGPSADSNLVEAIDPDGPGFQITDQSLSLTNEETIEITLTLTTLAGLAYSIEQSTDLIRWEPAPINPADFDHTNGIWFIGGQDTTNVRVEVPAETERKFFRPVR